jgi:multidrug transporter EmrE-like cation transporter
VNTFVLAVFSIALSVAAQFLLKAGMSDAALRPVLAETFTARTLVAVLANPWVLGGFVLYGLGALVWLAVLARWDVTKAYPLVGLGFLLTALVGYLLGEQLTAIRIAGIGLICAGVLLVGRS